MNLSRGHSPQHKHHLDVPFLFFALPEMHAAQHSDTVHTKQRKQNRSKHVELIRTRFLDHKL
jgi:hypothetical protein